MEHIRQLPSTCSDVTLNCMSKCIHTSCSCQSLWHTGHHLRIYKCNNRDILRVYAYHLTILLNISDNVVDSNLCCSTSCCRNCKNRNRLILCRCNTLKASDIFKLWVCNYNTDTLCSIHRRTTTDCDQVISTRLLECLNTSLYILDCWVWLNVGVNLIIKTSSLKYIDYLLGNTKFNQIRVRAYKCFLKSSSLCLCSNILNCSCAMIRCLI